MSNEKSPEDKNPDDEIPVNESDNIMDDCYIACMVGELNKNGRWKANVIEKADSNMLKYGITKIPLRGKNKGAKSNTDTRGK